ncbi:MAG: DUF2062 domain-containing protein [Desulforhopalus sp.]
MTAQIFKTLLVIPVYNHGKSLQQVTKAAIDTGFPVLVVDDGSTDGGNQGVEKLACQLIRLPENQGKGAAILTGARVAAELGYDAIITLDADGQHSPEEAIKLVQEAGRGSWPAMIIGAREMVQETVPGSSHFGRAFSNFWVRIECGAELSDTQSGMRLYPVRELLALKLSSSRYDFEIDAIVRGVWAGVPVRSVPVSVHYPPKSERVSHFCKFIDNLRLSALHSTLFFRRLLPIPHRRLVVDEKETKKPIVVKHPIQTLKNLCRENASPFWLAVAVWLGIVLGALPLLACHTLIIIYIAHRLHLNIIAAVAASQFCMPPVMPALCIEAGYFLRNGEFIYDLSWERWLLEIHHRLLDWLLGSLIIGPVLGCIGAFIVYWAAGHMQMKMVKHSG